MSIKKIRLYANITLVALVAAVVIIFLLSNREIVAVKFLGWELWKSPLYTLIFASANLGIISFLVGKRISLIIKQLKEVRKEKKIRQRLQKEMQAESEK